MVAICSEDSGAELLSEAKLYQGTSPKYCANAISLAKPKGLGARTRLALGVRPSGETIRVAEETIFSALPPCRQAARGVKRAHGAGRRRACH